jgi:hypothetical protein
LELSPIIDSAVFGVFGGESLAAPWALQATPLQAPGRGV